MQPGTATLQIVTAGLTGMTFTEIATLAGLGLNLALFVLAFTKGMEKIKDTIRAEIKKVEETINKRVEELAHIMADHELDDERRFSQVARDIDAAGDSIRKELGETIRALKEHVHLIQLTIKDGVIEFGKQLSDTRHTLYGRIEQQNVMHLEGREALEKRVREMEINNARKG